MSPKIGWPRRLLSSSGATALQTACKPDSVVDDHSSRRRVAAPLQQPTRGFRPPVARISPPWRIGPIRSCPPGECGRDPCLFGLAPCGVYHAASIAGRPVRSYRTFSPLPPAVCSDRLAPDRPFRGGIFSVALAVQPPSRGRPGRYPAHCPAESGLSSPSQRRTAGGSDRPAACKINCTVGSFKF
jgi:hypothetical protein